jgi:hypothetical protein
VAAAALRCGGVKRKLERVIARGPKEAAVQLFRAYELHSFREFIYGVYVNKEESN